jgi:glycosyltransferase involved in cell wall biosynthesis
MKPINIAILLDSNPLTWTSQEDRHYHLSRALIERGIQPILVFSEIPKAEIAERLRASGAKVVAINYGHGPLNYLLELRKLAREFSIDTAHIVFFDYFSALPWIARLAGVRQVIYEMQNSGSFGATSFKRVLLRLRTKLMTWPVMRMIAISKFVKEQLVLAGVPEEKIVVRYLGVDVERFVPNPDEREQWGREFNLRPEELALSTVSYLRPFKNPQVLVQACKVLSDRNVAARLFVAGDGEMLAELRALSEQLGVSDRIHWLGNVAEPKSLLQASDVFVLASVGEAFGLVLAEAMACGTPVVGSRNAGIAEVVADGETGLLATPLEPESFADRLEQLWNQPGLREQLGRNSIQRVRQSFSMQQVVDNTVEIYESL